MKTVGIRLLFPGDLACLVLMLGREDAAMHWCVWCRWKATQWQRNAGTGEAWTLPALSELYHSLFDDVDTLLDHYNKAKFLGISRMGIKRESLFDKHWMEIDDILLLVLHI